MSRLPELEQELVATAERLSNAPRRFERRARTLVPAVALACVVAALVAVGLFEANDEAVRGRHSGPTATEGRPPTVAEGAFPADATLEDMLGIFRRPQTAADDMGFTKKEMEEVPDRQPGEDFTQSRRVEWPGERIFLWPMRDGVCYGSGCVRLEALRRKGVSIGTGSARGHWSVYGVVVDGIHEVFLTGKDGLERRVPVRENFFIADVTTSVDRVRWRYAGQDQSVGNLLPDLPDGPPPPDPHAGFKPVPGSLSDPVRFTAGDVSFSAVGYQAANDTVCMRVFEEQTDQPTRACQGIRGLHDQLDKYPAELFAAGGTAHRLGVTYSGFARGDVTAVEAVERTSDITIVLSEPWTPAPWEGEPIRFLMVLDTAVGEPRPGTVDWPRLRVRLADGRSYLIES